MSLSQLKNVIHHVDNQLVKGWQQLNIHTEYISKCDKVLRVKSSQYAITKCHHINLTYVIHNRSIIVLTTHTRCGRIEVPLPVSLRKTSQAEHSLYRLRTQILLIKIIISSINRQSKQNKLSHRSVHVHWQPLARPTRTIYKTEH